MRKNVILLYIIWILHQTTTIRQTTIVYSLLYIIWILHQTTTYGCACYRVYSCILSGFYIKPQLLAPAQIFDVGCILSGFYIKPQQVVEKDAVWASCILSGFYIKPQLAGRILIDLPVVYYLDSTSNHNKTSWYSLISRVVYYLDSTSNHNPLK